MQVPGPTLIVTEGQTVTVNLTNGLPAAAGNTSILFPGFNVTATGGVAGLLTQEAAPGGTVTYTFIASSPGTRAYYSGTQGDLQVEMGLYGAIIVLPNAVPAVCTSGTARREQPDGGSALGRIGFPAGGGRLRPPQDLLRPGIPVPVLRDGSQHPHPGVGAGQRLMAGCTAGAAGCSLNVPTEPYHPAYFMINGRSMPDDMDPNYAHPVSAPALQRRSSHASGRAGAAARHRPGPVAASVPRARQPCAHPGARREPDSQRDRSDHARRARCCSPPRRLRGWPSTGSSTSPAGA